MKTPDDRDRRIADCLQRVLLRTSLQELTPNLTLEAYYEAVMEEAAVGGDSFDAFPLDGGRVALMVGDASGKGLGAAERIAEVRFALRAFLREHVDPCRALACLNDFVCDAHRLGKREDSAFVTLTLVALNSLSGEMICLCAGGEPPLILRAGGAVEMAQVQGMALGFLRDQEYSYARLRLDPGDMVLLVTDGLTEARAPQAGLRPRARTFLGVEGIARLARQAQDPRAPLETIGQSIFDGARAFAGGAFHDDACLLLARREN
ncbi:hypothetical protein CCAX7_25040 [Capsulimonas corticalis]|uniref:Uncharacterized protein n=1 Tax=Capsulimonas corticalis TaxID=2219043 RepID=A0A402CVK7_9BACT|nr:PP2C family protein-serine/threonine phosphatase [Capsulimonas corticalis]BDI30453.1 hypothetical protein CCAX7_25040 [Capsulimonas corticalis]